MTPRNPSIPRARRAFTLIELLVVIAIIAILAAILFPVFAQAKQAAKKTADLSNMKQIGTGILMYSADSDDDYPRGTYFRPDYAVNALYSWREGIFPYVKSGGTYPAYNNAQLRVVGGLFRGPGEPSNSIQGYGGHDGLMPSFQGVQATGVETAVIPSRSQTEVQNVAGVTIVTSVGLASSYGYSGGDVISDYWPWGGSHYPPTFDGPNSGVKYDGDTTNVYPFYKMPRFRYTESTNAAFTDGHAKSIKRGAYNWCKYVYTKGWKSTGAASDDYLFSAGQPCAAYAN